MEKSAVFVNVADDFEQAHTEPETSKTWWL
jgi:hypothetical protein